MAKEKVKIIRQGAPLGGMYFIAFIGAAVYFVQQSHGFWGFLYALLKACVWPAITLYRALTLMHV